MEDAVVSCHIYKNPMDDICIIGGKVEIKPFLDVDRRIPIWMRIADHKYEYQISLKE